MLLYICIYSNKVSMKENEHVNHRKRLYETISLAGFENVNDFIALEYILAYVIPRQDTNPIAHRLLEKFGTISRVLDSEVEELVKVKGLGLQSARMLTMLPKILERYEVDKQNNQKRLTSIQKIADYGWPRMKNKDIEELYMLVLDKNDIVLGFTKCGVGSIDTVSVKKHKILADVISYKNARYIVLMHCHPNNTIAPSSADKNSYNEIKELLHEVGIHNVESLIYGHRMCYACSNGSILKVGR